MIWRKTDVDNAYIDGRFRTWVIAFTTFQQVDNVPNGQSRSQNDNKDLRGADGRRKLHVIAPYVYLLK